jgi:hypothetical protein
MWSGDVGVSVGVGHGVLSPTFALCLNSAAFSRLFRRFRSAHAVLFFKTRAVETNPLETFRAGVR